MNHVLVWLACGALTASAASPTSTNQNIAPEFAGTWQIDLTHSDEVPAWKQMELVIAPRPEGVSITRNLGWGRRRFSDSITVNPDDGEVTLPLEWWPDNRHLGVYAADDHQRTVKAEILDEGLTLRTETRFAVETQQGSARMRILSEYRLWPDGNRLTLTESRSSRMAPITYTFVRKS